MSERRRASQKIENWTGSEVKQVLTRNWSSVVWKWGEVGRLLYRGEGTPEREREPDQMEPHTKSGWDSWKPRV